MPWAALSGPDPTPLDEPLVRGEVIECVGFAALRLVVVIHCFRESDDVIRIISARKASRTERRHCGTLSSTMRGNYDFSKGRKNPYAKRLKRSVTIRLDESTVTYFKDLAEETGIPYQTLINLYLRDCAQSQKRLAMKWRGSKAGAS